MTMTDEALAMIELDAALASLPILSHYVEVLRSGIEGAPQEVKENGEALLLKLEHLVRQHAPSSPFSPTQKDAALE